MWTFGKHHTDACSRLHCVFGPLQAMCARDVNDPQYVKSLSLCVQKMAPLNFYFIGLYNRLFKLVAYLILKLFWKSF